MTKKYTAKEIMENALRMEGEARQAGLNEARAALRAENGLAPDVPQANTSAGQTGSEGLTPTQGYLKYLDAYKNNRFQYDQNVDPIYQQAREAAIRQGQLAAKDVAAQAAQLTGGYGNSYGAMAAGQAYNQYLQGVNDMVPELAQNAYARYQDEQNRNLTLSQMYLQQEERDYNRRMNEAQLAAQYGDYGGLNGLGIDTGEYENKESLDRAWELETRDRQRTEWTQEDEARMWQFALQYAQYGDYSKLKDLGVDVSTQQRRDALEEALQYAQVYDYSKLLALGVNTDLLEAQKAATMAGLYGGSTGGSRSGSGYKDIYDSGDDLQKDDENEIGFDIEAYKRNLLNINPNKPEDSNFAGRGLTYLSHTVSNGVVTITAADADRNGWILKLDAKTGNAISVNNTGKKVNVRTGAMEK
ncbi:MAG: hypothetical protein IKN04_04125 [Clostridia bacterium]|nr:hypothetical protein [Clostridia bacterium]